jgi:hypothetical protein
MFNKKNKVGLSQLLIGGAVVAVTLSAVGWLGNDIWLASSQWLLVASVLALFGVYIKVS